MGWLATSLALLLMVSCGPARDVAPFGIASVSWPTEAAGAQAVFDALPDEIGGLTRDDGPPLSASYGDGAIAMWAEDLGASECPGLIGVDLVRAALGGDVDVESQAPDPLPEGVPPYLVGRLSDGGYAAGWSIPGCSWVFAVEAASPELREAAASAFADAAAG